jgi:hypothetical protein
MHARGCSGFIPNALVISKSNQKTWDYHNEINGGNYIRVNREVHSTPGHNSWPQVRGSKGIQK